MQIVFSYDIGYGRHKDSFEVNECMTDAEIEGMVRDAVMEKLDWSWTKKVY